MRAGHPPASIHRGGPAIRSSCVRPSLYDPPEVDDWPPLLDWLGALEGDWRLDEPLELFDEFDDEPDELDEPEELDEPDVVPDEPVGLLDVLWCDDVPWSFSVVCAAPGSTAISAPVTATLAKDTVMVVAFRRRLPCSRSATARAISDCSCHPVLHGRLQGPFGEI